MKLTVYSILGIIAVICFVLFAPYWPSVVKTNEEGVVTTLGKIKDTTTGEGVYFRSPFITRVQRIDMRERISFLLSNFDASTEEEEQLYNHIVMELI